jgi:hypothetical protein
MHFSGVAARWFSSLGDHCHELPWSEFCGALMECFGKDEHEMLIHKLFRIR